MRRAKPLRIAVVAPPWYEVPPRAYGGIETVCHLLAEGLVARGHEVSLFAAGGSRTDATLVRTLPDVPSDPVGHVLPEIIHTATVRDALAELDPDVIHDHSFLGPLLAERRGAPTLVTVHGPVEGPMLGYYRALGEGVSMVAISDLQRRLAPDLPWVATVPNAVAVAQFPFEERKGEHALFLGRLHPDKGAHVAIDAARAAGVPLVLAGRCEGGEEQRYLEEQLEPRLGDDAVWVGEADFDRKRELLAGARCLLFPIQWNEPFGLVMIEAMACGTPVVALSRGSVPEVVAHERTGFACRSEDELPRAIREADRLDPAECRRWVEERFGPERMVAGYERAYLDVLRRRPRAPRVRHAVPRTVAEPTSLVEPPATAPATVAEPPPVA